MFVVVLVLVFVIDYAVVFVRGGRQHVIEHRVHVLQPFLQQLLPRNLVLFLLLFLLL